jgi:DNA-directed RNA polymerase specialized sigma24 family protein
MNGRTVAPFEQADDAQQTALEGALEALKPIEHRIVEAMRLGESIGKLSADLGLSLKGVEQIAARALEKLREQTGGKR